ncbi:MAG: cobyric acid synthase [Dermatophilaceae bacterium]
MSGLLVAGTTSDAGKSVVTTGLCRAFARRGVRVAPFKAQNMSNNSMVCAGPDGGTAEIGRAQWVQALAAGMTPEPAMNPVLLKPGGDRRSHVVLMGRPAGTVSSSDWMHGRSHLAAAAHAAFDDLESRVDVVVAEGAGSPAEINLRAGDYVNMGLAQHGSLPTVVVGDIDRGGVFAAMYGTVALLDPADQALVAGFVVNKLRGDASLLTPGIDALTRMTGRRTFGVIPWHPGLWLDSEDALDLDGRRSRAGGREAGRRAGDGGHGTDGRDTGGRDTRRLGTELRSRADDRVTVAVIRLPRISNLTDVDALGLEPDLDVVFVARPADLADADLVVLPGTRATVDDLAWMRGRGLDAAVRTHAAAGRPVLGICGGFQMLGSRIADPHGVEGPAGRVVDGLGLLDVRTDFVPEKTLRLPVGSALGAPASGYEIHHGTVTVGADAEGFLGGARQGPVLGTMWHGSLEGDALRGALLLDLFGRSPSTASFPAARAARLDLLGDLVETHLDVDALLDLARSGPPAGLPVLPPAGGVSPAPPPAGGASPAPPPAGGASPAPPPAGGASPAPPPAGGASPVSAPAGRGSPPLPAAEGEGAAFVPPAGGVS